MLIARSVHPLPGEAERKERLLALVDGFSSRRVLVVGDLIADEFIYGEVARVSREAPVLILKYDATEMVAGGAGNAANNVAALGGRARLVGLVGADPEGRRLLASFHRGVDRARSSARAHTARRSRRGSSPAASMPRGSRSCASIARPAGRSTSGEPRAREEDRAGARRLRRRAAVRLRLGPRHAGARRRRARGAGAAHAPAADSGAASTRATACSTTAA